MPRRRRKQSHPNWPLLAVIIAIVAACCCYLFAAVILQFGGNYRIKDIVVPRCLDLFVALWFFWFGSSIGSFLNVVAWRMPRGKSINGFSGCPFCATPIKSYDNIPVFGWLNLRGRCRSCHLPIAARYPIVELLVGLSIMLVGVIGLYSGGANLPFAVDIRGGSGPLSMPHITTNVIATNIYHVVMLTGVWAFALVRFDGFRLPTRLVVFFLSAAIIPMIAYPILQKVPWKLRTDLGWEDGTHATAVLYVVTAIVGACMLARILGRYVCPAADPKINPLGKDTGRLIDLIMVLLIPAIVLGWHALIAVCMIALLSAMFLHRKYPFRGGYEWLIASVPWAMMIQIVLWKPTSQIGLWPAPNHNPWVFLGWLAAIMILSADLRALDENLIDGITANSKPDVDDDQLTKEAKESI